MADLGLGTVSGAFWIPGSMLLGGGIGAGVVGGIGSPGRLGVGGVGCGGRTSAATARLDRDIIQISRVVTHITCVFMTGTSRFNGIAETHLSINLPFSSVPKY